MNSPRVQVECLGCRSLSRDLIEGQRLKCLRHGWGIAAVDVSVCRDWSSADRPMTPGVHGLLKELDAGKLYEIHGSHEHFVEVDDLSLEGKSEFKDQWDPKDPRGLPF